MENQLYNFLKIIAEGKQNAITTKELSIALNTSSRIIRKQRELNNKNNSQKIITCDKGYFIPSEKDKEEIKKSAYTKIKCGLAQIKEAKELFRFYNLNDTLKIDFDTLEIKENKIGDDQNV